MEMKKQLAAAMIALAVISGLHAQAMAEDDLIYEAENARLYGDNRIVQDSAASGGKAVGKFENDESCIVFQIDVPRDGYYDLSFTMKGIGNGKTNLVYVDGTDVGSVSCEGEDYSADTVRNIPLTLGRHEVSLRKDWGWIYLDCLSIAETSGLTDAAYQVTAPLINPHATSETRALYDLLRSCFGRYTLSGQVSDAGIDSEEFAAIFSVTDKYPAILGLDMRDYTPSRMAFGVDSSAVERAVTFHNLGGIVTFCWHWNAPQHTIYSGRDRDGNPYWWGGFFSDHSSFNIRRVMQGEDPEGKEALDRDIKAIAAQLKRLEERHVPVLWRPLHEASGGWFWWGAGGADCYKQLWIYLYKQLTDVYACNNLIWVWNGQDPAWYPGDEYVDIIGEDIYVSPKQYATHISKFTELLDYPENPKIIALTENCVPPDMDACAESGVLWSWFCIWKGDYVVKDGQYSAEYTDRDVLRKTYHHERVITLDELAGLRQELSGTTQTHDAESTCEKR